MALVYLLWALIGSSAGRAGQESALPRNSQEAVEGNQSLEQRADLYMVRKYYPEAIELYKQLVAQQPNNALFHNKLGIAYHQLQNLDAAKRASRKAVQLNPQYGQAINNLAAVAYAQKNYREAILTYLKALAFSPNDAVVYSNLGTAYFAFERFEYAMTSYRYALQLDPTIFQRGGRSGTIVQQRDEKNAAAFNFYLAKTYAGMGNVEDTLQYLRKAWEEGYPDIRKGLEDKAFAFLSAEPRFIELVQLIEASEQEKNGANAPQSQSAR